MTRREPTPDGAVLVAIDIAKTRNEVLIEPSRDGRRRRLTVLNARADHDRLIKVLKSYGAPVIAGMRRPATIIARSPGGWAKPASPCA